MATFWWVTAEGCERTLQAHLLCDRLSGNRTLDPTQYDVNKYPIVCRCTSNSTQCQQRHPS